MGLLLLRLPLRVQRLVFGRSGRVFGLGTSRGRGGLAVFQHHLGLAPGGLVDAPARDLFDEELGEGPHQRIGAVDEFRISVEETYDVIVQPPADRAYTLFVQPEDRSASER